MLILLTRFLQLAIAFEEVKGKAAIAIIFLSDEWRSQCSGKGGYFGKKR
ncbi:MAG: hypothetical protein ACRC6M_00025 [Microcystaceae cyanobacterium]